jgi:hypothetical protein
MAYATVDEAQDWLRISDSVDAVWVQAALTAAEEMVNEYCSRPVDGFAAISGVSLSARTFRADRYDQIETDDIGTSTGLIVETDEDGDGTFENTWTATDYQLEPLNNLARSWPVWRIRVSSNGNYLFPVDRQALIRVTAKWGWPATPAPVKQAVILEASRILRRREAVFGVVEAPSGTFADRLYPAMDPTSQILLNPYRKMVLA